METTKETIFRDPKTGLVIDASRDERLTDFAKKLITDYYLQDGETIQEGFARAAFAWSSDNDHAQRLYEAVSKGWFMYASPVLSNAPSAKDVEKRIFHKAKALPISCFGNYVDDSVQGLIDHSSETRWLSVMGGGVGADWSNVRSASKKTPGPIPFIHTIDADMEAYMQARTRRGSYAAYMNVSHPDILEFLNLRVPTGDASRKCHSAGFHNAVNITDDFMTAVDFDTNWNLVDPHSGEVRDTVKARELWNTILDIRYRTGEPYLHFIDTSNSALPWVQRHKGLRIHNTNLCSEIFLPNNSERTFVCCLSSINLEKYDEWQGTSLVRDLIKMLDNIITYFVDNAPDAISKARYSAMMERSLGLGVMGFHNLLQKNMIAFESRAAQSLNKEIFKYIDDESIAATIELGREFGEAPDLITDLTISLETGMNVTISSSEMVDVLTADAELTYKRAFDLKVGDYILSFGNGKVVEVSGLHSHSGRRNAQLHAIAPTANSAILCGTSPSIEPSNSNAYVHQTRAGSWPVKNRYLEALLEIKGYNDEATWSEIIGNKGSIQHMDIFNEDEKNVFKTAIELNMMWVVQHAADRQPHVSQGQSVNLFFPPRCSRDYFHKVHRAAHKYGLKSLYYVRTIASNRVENVSKKMNRVALKDADDSGECLACQG